MIAFPILAAAFKGLAEIVEKILLSRLRNPPNVVLVVGFGFIFLFTALVFPFGWDLAVFKARNLVLFISVIVLALGWNYIYFHALAKEKIQEFELFIMLWPLVTVLLAGLLLAEERQLSNILAAVVGALALIFTHLKKSKVNLVVAEISTPKPKLDKYGWAMILAVFFMAMETIVVKELLKFTSPISLYFWRTGVILLILTIALRPRLKDISPRSIKYFIILGAVASTGMILSYYGYYYLGVINTTLILLLMPIFVYFFDSIVLHEKLKPRFIIAAVIILGCIAYVHFF